MFLTPALVFPLQPVPGGRGGELRDLVPLQLPHLPSHAGGQLVLDALALPGLQVSVRALLAKHQGSPNGLCSGDAGDETELNIASSGDSKIS